MKGIITIHNENNHETYHINPEKILYVRGDMTTCAFFVVFSQKKDDFLCFLGKQYKEFMEKWNEAINATVCQNHTSTKTVPMKTIQG